MTAQFTPHDRSRVRALTKLRLALLAGAVVIAQVVIFANAASSESAAASPLPALSHLMADPQALAAGVNAPAGAQGSISSAAIVGAVQDASSTGSAPLVTDPFGRIVTKGWGDASSGGSWVLSNASDFSVNGSRGTVSLGAGGQSDTATLSALSVADTLTSVAVAVKALPKDGLGTYASVVVRATNNFVYRGTLSIGPDGFPQLSILRLASGEGSGGQLLRGETGRQRNVSRVFATQGVAEVVTRA